jgi:hypothetical protein
MYFEAALSYVRKIEIPTQGYGTNNVISLAMWILCFLTECYKSNLLQNLAEFLQIFLFYLLIKQTFM